MRNIILSWPCTGLYRGLHCRAPCSGGLQEHSKGSSPSLPATWRFLLKIDNVYKAKSLVCLQNRFFDVVEKLAIGVDKLFSGNLSILTSASIPFTASGMIGLQYVLQKLFIVWNGSSFWLFTHFCAIKSHIPTSFSATRWQCFRPPPDSPPSPSSRTSPAPCPPPPLMWMSTAW